jgi:Ca2+-binding EF-hand superfamily protein
LFRCSGTISSTELRQVLTKSGQMKLTDEEVDEMVEGVDEVEEQDKSISKD